MILLFGTALAADPTPDALPCPPPATPYIADVAATGDETSYRCLINTDGFDADLVAAIRSASPEDPALPRYTRALALYLAARPSRPFNPEHVRLLNPADRRLLADAVRAQRGRKSPSEDHDRIFQKQSWYAPRPGYTDNQLTDVDRANIALADNPNAVAPPPILEPATEPVPATTSACGCSSATAGPMWALVAAILLIRRRSA